MKNKITTKLPINERRISDTSIPIAERKIAYKKVMDKHMNPLPQSKFNPDTWEPMDDDPDIEVKRRKRLYPERRLPTMGIKPKELYTGQMIGMYESKQDLYLLIAWLSERVTDLEDKIDKANIN